MKKRALFLVLRKQTKDEWMAGVEFDCHYQYTPFFFVHHQVMASYKLPLEKEKNKKSNNYMASDFQPVYPLMIRLCYSI